MLRRHANRQLACILGLSITMDSTALSDHLHSSSLYESLRMVQPLHARSSSKFTQLSTKLSCCVSSTADTAGLSREIGEKGSGCVAAGAPRRSIVVPRL